MQQILMPRVVNVQSFLPCSAEFLINLHRLWWKQSWQIFRPTYKSTLDLWQRKTAQNFQTYILIHGNICHM